jgi:hypothetical protein
MEENYFQFDQQYYKETDGLAIGAPTSSVLAETYIQHMEHKHIYPILKKIDWGNLVPRINVEIGIKLGFVLE